MNVYIITPTWNCSGEIAHCARALVAHTHIPVRWVVVENGSEPDERLRIWAALSIVRGAVGVACFIENEDNLGIPVAQNQALDWIAGQDSGPYSVVMLDADTEPQEGWLEYLLQFGEEHPNVGLVGGARSPDGPSLPVYYNQAGRWYQHEEMDGQGEYCQGECVDFATVLFPWAILKRGIRFDEGYIIYDGYDQDLAFRVRSWEYTVCQSEARVIHRPSTVMKDRDYQWSGGGRREWDALRRRNVARFAQIWQPFLAPRRPTIEAEMIHMEVMAAKLVVEAGERKQVPGGGG